MSVELAPSMIVSKSGNTVNFLTSYLLCECHIILWDFFFGGGGGVWREGDLLWIDLHDEILHLQNFKAQIHDCTNIMQLLK